MATDLEIQQLLDAVAKHPGSPAYALLAEHYLALDKVDAALDVCSNGFAANPGHERGDELVCFSVLSEDKLTRLGRRMWRKGRDLYPAIDEP